MSFGFLPAPIYILGLIVLFIITVRYSVKSFGVHSKQLAIGYCFIGIGLFLEAVIKFIEEYWLAAIGFSGTLKVMVGICIVGGFILIAVNIWRESQGDVQKRKYLKICLGVMFASLLLLALIVLSEII